MNITNTVKAIQDIMRKDVGVDGDAQRLGQLVWLLFLKILDDREVEWEMFSDDYVSPLPDNLRWRTWAANPEGATGDDLKAFVDETLFPGLQALGTDRPTTPLGSVVRNVFTDSYNYMKSGHLLRQVLNRLEQDIDFNESKSRHAFGEIYEQLLRSLQNAGNAGEFYTPRAVTDFIIDRLDPKLGDRVFDPACGTGGFLTGAIEHKRAHYTKTATDDAVIDTTIFGVEKKPLPYTLAITNMMLHGIEEPIRIRQDNTLARPLISWGPSERFDVIAANPPFGGNEEDGIENNFPSEFRTRETADLFMALFMKVLSKNGRAGIVLPDGFMFGEGVKTRIKERLLTEFNLHTIVRLPNGVFNPYSPIRTNLLFFTKGKPTTKIWFYEHPYPKGYKNYTKTRPIRVGEFAPEKEWWGSEEDEFASRVETDQAWVVSAEEIKQRGYNLDVKNPRVDSQLGHDPLDLLPGRQNAEEAVIAARLALADALNSTLAERPELSKPWSLMLTHFHDIFTRTTEVDALEKAVLKLAIDGYLVPQIPSEEPADEILSRIEASTAATSKSPHMNGTEVLPQGWAPTTIGRLVRVLNGRAYKREELLDSGTPVLRVGNLFTSKHWYYSDLTLGEDKYCNPGDLIFAWSASFGPFIWSGERVIYHYHIWKLDPLIPEPTLKQYVYLYLLAKTQEIRESGHGISMAHMTKAKMERLSVHLPPLKEQDRIVARVNELLDLCRELKHRLGQADIAQEQFAAAATKALAFERLQPLTPVDAVNAAG